MRKLLIAAALLIAVIAAVAGVGALPPPNVDRAVASQRALVEKHPSAEHWNDLGNLLELAGQNDEAGHAYEKALALDDKLPTAHYNLALLLRQQGEDHKALEHLRTATDLDPTNGWAWFEIGSLEEAHGSEGSAVRAYARAYALDARLSFVDVNPQVVDSKLTTQALLIASAERSPVSEAPRQYEDPRHVAKLLLPQLPAGAPTPAPTPATAQQLPHAGAPAASGSKQQVLGPQDLQHTGHGSGTMAGRPAPAPSAGSPAYSDLLRQRLLEQQQQQEQSDNQGGDEEQQQEDQGQGQVPGGAMAPPVGVYVPEPRSSGQLEQRLDLPGVVAPAVQQPAR